jgi:hypothetical protein
MRVRCRHFVRYRTDINEKNVVEHLQLSSRRYSMSILQLTVNAKGSLGTAVVAYIDDVVQKVDDYKGEYDGNDPIHGRQREHGSGHSEEPFP